MVGLGVETVSTSVKTVEVGVTAGKDPLIAPLAPRGNRASVLVVVVAAVLVPMTPTLSVSINCETSLIVDVTLPR